MMSLGAAEEELLDEARVSGVLELLSCCLKHSACWGSSSLGVRGRRGWVTREWGVDSLRLGWQFIQVWGTGSQIDKC